METLTSEFAHLSPPVALLAFLYVIGIVFKKSSLFPDKFIPLTQVLLGAVAYPLISDVLPTGYYYPLPSKVLIGGLIGGGTVAGHQIIKQFLAKKGITLPGDTEITEKSDK